jgi:hypothetical protein
MALTGDSTDGKADNNGMHAKHSVNRLTCVESTPRAR